MELRNPDTPVNAQRGQLVGGEIVEIYSQKEDPIMSFDPDSRGQLQLVLSDMMFQPQTRRCYPSRAKNGDEGRRND